MSLIELERRGRVGLITLANPTRRNALDDATNSLLVDAFDELEADEQVGAIVVTGTDSAFCAGANLTAIGEGPRHEGVRRIYRGFTRAAQVRLPLIAAVNGSAVGAGFNLALAADVRIVSPRARFDTRFLDLGLHPGGGNSWMLRRIVGPQVAAALLLCGQIVDGTEAERIGLALRCVPEEHLVDHAVELAARAASGPRSLVIEMKETLAAMADIDSYDAAVAYELDRQVASMDESAFQERFAALQAKVQSRPGA